MPHARVSGALPARQARRMRHPRFAGVRNGARRGGKGGEQAVAPLPSRSVRRAALAQPILLMRTPAPRNTRGPLDPLPPTRSGSRGTMRAAVECRTAERLQQRTVRTVRLSTLLRKHGVRRVGKLKIDAQAPRREEQAPTGRCSDRAAPRRALTSCCSAMCSSELT